MDILILAVILLIALGILYVMFTEMLNFVQTRVPFVPTAKKDLQDLVKRVEISEIDYVYDLGSGNGKVVFFIEQATGAKVKGIQRAGWAQTWAKARARVQGSKAEFVSGNFFDHPWAEATIIYAYLYPFLMSQVCEKALDECRPGTKLVIRDFPIASLQPSKQWQTPSNHTMYLYVI